MRILFLIVFLSASAGCFAQADTSRVVTDSFLTSSLRHPKALVKEFSYFLMPCHQHCLGVNLLVQR